MNIAVLGKDSEDSELFIHPFALLLKDGVESGASLGYLAHVSVDSCEEYWESALKDVSHGKGKIIYCEIDGSIVGVVFLAFAEKETAQHRAEVRKLLVRTDMRGRGIGKKLMEILELEARISGKSLLYLDTESGSPADYLYPLLGWNELGIIPKYAASPNGRLADCTFYWKEID